MSPVLHSEGSGIPKATLVLSPLVLSSSSFFLSWFAIWSRVLRTFLNPLLRFQDCAPLLCGGTDLAAAHRVQSLRPLSFSSPRLVPVNGDSERRILLTQPKEKKMESNMKQNQQKPGQVIYIEPQIFLRQDGEYVVHVLPGNVRVRKHINYYILNRPI